jgi:hypothetical protein
MGAVLTKFTSQVLIANPALYSTKQYLISQNSASFEIFGDQRLFH